MSSACCHHQGGLSIIASCISIHASCQGQSHLLNLAVLAPIKEDLVVVVIVIVSKLGKLSEKVLTAPFAQRTAATTRLNHVFSPAIAMH